LLKINAYQIFSFIVCTVFAGALKCYLRELPEPLLTFELYNDWMTAAGWVSTCGLFFLYQSFLNTSDTEFKSIFIVLSFFKLEKKKRMKN